MDTPNKLNDATERGSCSWQGQRQHDPKLTRSVAALLGTEPARKDAEIIHALMRLMGTDVIRDLEQVSETVDRDGPFALLSLRFTRTAPGGWSIDIVAQCQVHAFDNSEDHTDVTAVRVAHGLWHCVLDVGCALSLNELDHLHERCESARAHVRQQCHDDAIEAASEVR